MGVYWRDLGPLWIDPGSGAACWNPDSHNAELFLPRLSPRPGKEVSRHWLTGSPLGAPTHRDLPPTKAQVAGLGDPVTGSWL